MKMNARKSRLQRMGALGSSSSASGLLSPPTLTTSPTPPQIIPPDIPASSGGSGSDASSIAATAASLAQTGSSIVKGVLGAEAAQNAINAQKNLTSALTPGVITMGLAILAYWLVTKK